MKATRELIDAFRVTADRIESGEYKFNWYNSNNCWCGCLAQTVLNINDVELHKLKKQQNYDGGVWTDTASNRCSTTGLPLHDVLLALYKIGIITKKDVDEIEHIGRNAADDGGFDNEENGIKWMRDKADQLEKQLLNENVITTNKVVQVQSVGV